MLKNIVSKNSYYDSATLMLLSTNIMDNVQGVEDVAVMMATDMNKSLMRSSNLLDAEGEKAQANDMIFAIVAKDQETIDKAVNFAKEQLEKREEQEDTESSKIVKSVDIALNKYSNLNMAVVSLPGNYAKREVVKLLKNGVDVLLFSDNVSIEEEIELKDLALENGLLMMGPDCGTAIINGVGLGFANEVRIGDIGLVGASGTGLQEVFTLIDKYGHGISQAYGTGGRDIKSQVGAKMMLEAINRLEKDENTNKIVVISKPPSEDVLNKVVDRLKKSSKEVIACFIGAKKLENLGNIKQAYSLEEAARLATGYLEEKELDDKFISQSKAKLGSSQKYVRGLYAGGTLAYEAMLLLRDEYGHVYSNTPLDKEDLLEDVSKSKEHSVIDLGDDEFTRGKPHPMIDPSLRSKRLLDEARDEEVAVILLDVEIGYGSHANPAEIVSKQVREAREVAKSQNRELVFISSICGTEKDYQDYHRQKKILEDAGVFVTHSNREAIRYAIEILR